MGRWLTARLLLAISLDGIGDAARATLTAAFCRCLGLTPRLLQLSPGAGSMATPVPSGAGPVWCLLSPSDVLELTQQSPATNLLDLWRALSMNITELLPLKSELVAWDIVPAEHGGQIYIVRRTILDTAVNTVRAAGLEPDRIGVTGNAAVDFRRLQVARLRRKAMTALTFTVTLWLGIVLPPALWAGYLNWDTRRIEAILAQQAVAVHETADMRARIAFLAEEQRTGGLLLSQPARMPLLDLIAELLPDDAVLVELSLQKDAVRLRGRTADAGALLAQIRAHPRFTDARFATPIAPAPDGKAELFTIVSGEPR